MTYEELPLVFRCGPDRLVGILAKPVTPPLETAVLIIVGGPQYRAGSHRQFTLLARDLAASDIASLRFDYRGMGDSEGECRSFEAIGPDISAAIGVLFTQVPGLRNIVLWGLCDAASAAMIYGHTDPRVAGLVLLNPWVHTEESAAQVRLKHYYLRRLVQASFWQKLLSGRLRLWDAMMGLIISFGANLRRRIGSDSSEISRSRLGGAMAPQRHSWVDDASYIEKMCVGLFRFTGRTLLILSGNDLVAREFSTLIAPDSRWQDAIRRPRLSKKTIESANHTFSSSEWRRDVATLTKDFVRNVK